MVFTPEAIERSCQDFVGRLIKSDILIKNKHNLSQRGSSHASRRREREGGLFPYKSDGGAPRKTSKTSLKGTRMYFCGYGLNSFSFIYPLQGTNSTAVIFVGKYPSPQGP